MHSVCVYLHVRVFLVYDSAGALWGRGRGAVAQALLSGMDLGLCKPAGLVAVKEVRMVCDNLGHVMRPPFHAPP